MKIFKKIISRIKLGFRNIPENLARKFNSTDHEDLMGKLAIIFSIAISFAITAPTLYFMNFDGGFSAKNGDWGTFGDFFGGTLNPILSFLSLTALLFTIVLQSRQAEMSKKELELSREELTETRKELARSASAHEKAEKIQAKQFFESKFFNLLELHHKLASELKFDARRITEKASTLQKKHLEIEETTAIEVFEGRLAFDGVINFVSQSFGWKKPEPEIVLSRYKLIQEESNEVLGHYFRNLYQILKTIKLSSDNIFSPDEKSGYASILRSQLSSKELALLFLNCLDGVSDDGRFKNLVIEFKMFEHLPIREIKYNDNNEFNILGAFPVSASMIIEYERSKEILQVDLKKHFGGAFGKNKKIPNDLSNRLKNGKNLPID